MFNLLCQTDPIALNVNFSGKKCYIVAMTDHNTILNLNDAYANTNVH
jgi:predicted metal-dependent phosphoesterase TrpH